MISMWTIYNLTDSISSGQSQQFQPTPVEINKFLTTKSHCNLNKDLFMAIIATSLVMPSLIDDNLWRRATLCWNGRRP